ncbi:hypothetical protein PSPO01_16512 [Paraphaeosphaeria sporulosa]
MPLVYHLSTQRLYLKDSRNPRKKLQTRSVWRERQLR